MGGGSGTPAFRKGGEDPFRNVRTRTMKQREGRRTAIIGLSRPTPALCPCSSVVEQRFCKALVAGSNPAGGLIH